MALTVDESKLVKKILLDKAALDARRAARSLCERTMRYSSELPKALENYLHDIETVKKNIDIADRV